MKHRYILMDKTFLLACSIFIIFISGLNTSTLLALLTAVLLSSLSSYFPEKYAPVPILISLVISCLWPPLALLLPLLVYDCSHSLRNYWRFLWILPLLSLLFQGFSKTLPGCLLFSGLAVYLSDKTQKNSLFSKSYHQTQDIMREESRWLKRENRMLMEKQDYEVRLATLGERNRIAREIHDNVGHLITRSLLQIKALMVLHRQENTLEKDLAQVNDTLTDAMDNIRRSVHNIRDDSVNLKMQLQDLIRQFTFCPVTLHYDMENPPKEIKYCFLSIVREGLNNIARHSDATQAVLTLIEHPGLYRLTLADNGTSASLTASGFSDSASLSHTDGIGIQNMKERVESLSGIFRVDCRQGFQIFISIPKGGNSH